MATRSLLRPAQRPLLRPNFIPKNGATGYLQTRLISMEVLDKRKGDRERVLILGCGWAGYGVARALDTKYYQPVLITPRTYFVFTPLLASTAVGTLEFRTAMESARSLPGVEVVRGWANSADLGAKTLTIEGAREPAPARPLAPEEEESGGIIGSHDDIFSMPYDKLIVAVGCYSQTFNTPGVKEHAFFLKDVADARKIRRRVIERFEEAALPTVPVERKKELLHFAIVGGGPTGIEFAAELNDLITEDLKRAYPDVAGLAKISLFDVAPKVLSMFDQKLQSYASKLFQRQGISILTSHHVQEIKEDAIVTKEEGRIPVGGVVWSTGLSMNPFVTDSLGKEFRLHPTAEDQKLYKVTKDAKAGRIQTDSHLRALVEPSDKSFPPSHLDDVFALGDCAKAGESELPATAQVASQQAKYLSKALNTAARKQKALGAKTIDIGSEKPFNFVSLGIMAYLGGWRAITQSGTREVTGRLAWVLWRTAYLTKSVSWRNKLLIPAYWALNWIAGRDVNRF